MTLWNNGKLYLYCRSHLIEIKPPKKPKFPYPFVVLKNKMMVIFRFDNLLKSHEIIKI